MTTSRFHFTIDISAEEFLKYYSELANKVHTNTHEGITIEFPAINLKPWVSRNGISGTFMIEFDDDFRLQDLQRIS